MTDDVVDWFVQNTICRDFFGLIAGDELGRGIARRVHVFEPDPSLVLKFETPTHSFQNVQEWQVWDRIKDTKHARWFAPCVKISACGTVLLQKRAQPIAARKLPKRVPAFFTDMKSTNWGLIDDRAVSIDYGTHLLMEVGMTGRLRKADWSD